MTQFDPSAFAEVVGNLLRYLMWMIFAGLLAVGLCFGGGQLLCLVWNRDDRSSARRPLAGKSSFRRESARGITQIEAFLAAQGALGDTRKPPESAGDI
jgi:hypothetical protein